MAAPQAVLRKARKIFVPTGSGTTPLWSADVTQAGADDGKKFGFSFRSGALDGVKWDITYSAGGGPGGRNAVVMAFIPNSSGTGGAMEWSGTTGATAPSQGGSRFVRYYALTSNMSNEIGIGGGIWGCKTVIINADTNEERAIEVVTDHAGAPTAWKSEWQKNVNGGNDATPYTRIFSAADTWSAVQLEIKTSTTTSSGDGGYRIWVNNDTQGSPSGESAFLTSQIASQLGGLEWMGCDRIGIGFALTLKWAALEYDDAFDPNWYANMGS